MLHNPSYDFNDDLIPLGATLWVRLAEQRVLDARAAEALDAVAAAGDDEHPAGVVRAVAHDVERHLLAVAAAQRVHMRHGVEVGRLGGGEELRACLGVGLREVAGHGHDGPLQRGGATADSVCGAASQASASRAHRVAPSGIRSSLKS